jgi:phosphatidylinositol glycan class H protein
MPTRLAVRRPSPTTASFTVSNAPSRRTWPAKLAFGVEIIIRVLGFIAILLVNAATLRRSIVFEYQGLGIPPDLWLTNVGALAWHIADSYPYKIVAGVSIVLMYLVWRKGYTGTQLYWIAKYQAWSLIIFAEESLLVIRGLGVQTSTSSSMYWSSAATRFIPTTQIQDIVIHEAFKGFEVRFYLAIIVEGERDVVVVFPVGPKHPGRVIHSKGMLIRHC